MNILVRGASFAGVLASLALEGLRNQTYILSGRAF